MFIELKHKVVIITGASAGIGAAAAIEFAKAGAHLALMARHREPLDQFVHQLQQQFPEVEVLSFAQDANDMAAFAQLPQTVQHQWGRIDILVNNAGAHKRGPLINIDASDLANMIHTNVTTPILASRMMLDIMMQQDSQPIQGMIINIASLAGRTPVDGAATYSSSKFALRAFSYALDEEMRERAQRTGQTIRCCIVSPGPVATGFVTNELDSVADITFSQKLASTEHVARLIVQTAQDGKLERTSGGALAPLMSNIAYLFPKFKRALKPLMVKKGAKVKAKLKAQLQR